MNHYGPSAFGYPVAQPDGIAYQSPTSINTCTQIGKGLSIIDYNEIQIKISSLRIPEIKIILDKFCLPKGGRKDDLVDRISRHIIQHSSEESKWKALVNIVNGVLLLYVKSPIRLNHSNKPSTSTSTINGTGPSSSISGIPCSSCLVEVPTKEASDMLLKCTKCGRRQHHLCAGMEKGPSETDGYICAACIVSTSDPMLTVISTNYVTSMLFSGTGCYTKNFMFRIESLGKSNIERYRFQLRCMNLVSPTKKETNQWPKQWKIRLNSITLHTSHPSFQYGTKVDFSGSPLEIGPYLRTGVNTLEIDMNRSVEKCIFVVQRVLMKDVNSIENIVIENSKTFTKEMALKNVIESFNPNENSDGVDSDDDVIATSTFLSVLCPLSIGKMVLPARGKNCKHIQCFDLKTFLNFVFRNLKSTTSNPVPVMKCIICNKAIFGKDLIIDPYIREIIEIVREDDEIDEIEIFPDGKWEKKESSSELVEPPVKRTRILKNMNQSTSQSLSQPIAIDLTLSSDDEDASQSGQVNNYHDQNTNNINSNSATPSTLNNNPALSQNIVPFNVMPLFDDDDDDGFHHEEGGDSDHFQYPDYDYDFDNY